MPRPEEARIPETGDRPKHLSSHRLSLSHIPERFRTNDDEHEDLTAPPKDSRGHNARYPYMHQSVFSLIAAAGSKHDFHARFDDTSDSEEEGEGEAANRRFGRKLQSDGSNETSDGGVPLPQGNDNDEVPVGKAERGRGREHHRRMISDHKLFRSFHRRSRKSSKEKEPAAGSSPVLPPQESKPTLAVDTSQVSTSSEAPVLSRMIEAQTRFDKSVSPSESPDKSGPSRPSSPARAESDPAALLADRLMEIFEFEKPEKVLAEYQTWLLQSALLQGYMWVTEKHICFYAYLPRKAHSMIKSGYLSKRGRQNPKYSRYWFGLKGDVLSYYLDPSNLYFPSGHIDLRYSISANLAEQKGKDKDVKDFVITTDSRTYQLRADSAASAREWVKTLQKVIFRSHNEGDSVKISLPVGNVIDIEENPVLDFADTIKVRVVESGDSYAIDEYFFSFFECGKEAIELLKKLVNDTAAQHIARDFLTSPTQDEGRGTRKRLRSRARSLDAAARPVLSPGMPVLQEHVKATLRPSSAHSTRSVVTSKRNFDQGRRNSSTRRLSVGIPQAEKLSSGALPSSSESFVQSLEPATDSSAILQSPSDAAESASQILNRSDVFQSPTIHRWQRSRSSSRGRRGDTDETATGVLPVKVQPPSRTQTEEEARGRQPAPPQETGSESENELNNRQETYSAPSPTLQELVKAGSYPLQRAAGFAGYLKNRSKQMSSILASESMGYIEKVSGMWAGGGRHYGEGEGLLSGDQMVDPEDEEQGCEHGDRFRAHFALPPSEKLQATYFGYLHRVIPLYGKLYVGNRRICFRSLLPGTRTKMILPMRDIENVEKEKGFRFGYHGLVVIVSGHEELFFEFATADIRDDCAVTLHQGLESIRYLAESGILAQQDREESEAAKAEHQMLQEARFGAQDEMDSQIPSSANHLSPDSTPILFDDPRASIVNFKPSESLKITCLTIGSRGDVQPYIALCKGLIAEGHRPKIATHREFEPWVRKHGIEFAPVEGDPAELMRICVENGMFTYSFLREASLKFRGWIDDLLSSAWESCQGSDILIESPSAMAGIHIAEALRIPYFRAFTMPWTRTRAYPHAFAVPEHRMGGAYNYITYVMFDNVFWKAISGQVNRWRKRELGLRSTNLDRMQPNKVPFLYNFSPLVVPPPLDYSDWIRVTGNWFLNEGGDWTPPEDLANFIKKARSDGKKIVYIGFGSIVVSDPAALTKTVVDSVLRADVRCILSKGWSDRLGDPTSAKPEIPLPPEIHQITAAPHDWLFSQIDAAAHHGGAGTTGASLRAGVPTIIKPFFGDQFFFGTRVEDLGVGICMKRLNVGVFSRALWEATRSERMIVKARSLGEQIRKEDGVATAIKAIYRDLEYAKTLVKQRSNASAAAGSTPQSPIRDDDGDLEPIEDSWTFIGEESEYDDVARKRDEQVARDMLETSGAGPSGIGIVSHSSSASRIRRVDEGAGDVDDDDVDYAKDLRR
ncbi:hypothetical protein AJ80_04432 [Polytolypa hystricis UAMH7299]|uniref:Sterol 3-beta-glucosyltransferase n=1 Tax=Polytolypa hystricis (strain UAMH7299) TaxID=1447883 RepID=A0A2B7Y3K4_POLH7|nr:hypothetical protein AJ80_04432 [Polytolypa hystricis UAMH7299]